jgi:hypothetical protein
MKAKFSNNTENIRIIPAITKIKYRNENKKDFKTAADIAATVIKLKRSEITCSTIVFPRTLPLYEFTLRLLQIFFATEITANFELSEKLLYFAPPPPF